MHRNTGCSATRAAVPAAAHVRWRVALRQETLLRFNLQRPFHRETTNLPPSCGGTHHLTNSVSSEQDI
eukprot:3640071-Pleurochrysis_carterae.AAC.1